MTEQEMVSNGMKRKRCKIEGTGFVVIYSDDHVSCEV